MAVTKNNVGVLLAKVRKKQNRKQKDVAAALNKTVAYICDIEKGRRGQRMDPLLLMRWADYLNLPITVVLTHAGIIDEEYEAKYGQFLKLLRSKTRAKRVGICIDGARKDLDALKIETGILFPTVTDLVKSLELRIVELETTLTYGSVLLANVVLWGSYVA